MKRILVVNTSGMGVGGITTHMLNYISKLVKDGYDYRFTLVVTGIRDEDTLCLFEKLGCKLVFLPDRKRNPIIYLYELNKIMKNDFEILHVHGNSATMILELAIGKYHNIKKRIAHCHNTLCDHKIINYFLKFLFKRSYTNAVACSNEAGEWLFGKKSFIVLPNSIDLNKFKYSPKKRMEMRKKINISDDTFVIGHVGNFNLQKNHIFLIKIFFEIQKKINAKLLLIGNGELIEQVRSQVRKLNIEDKVIFLGIRNDVCDLMQAMDCFVLPSKWEGFGIVNIEAQAMSLPVFVSNAIPNSVKVTENFHFISLDKNEVFWANKIIECSRNIERKDNINREINKFSIDNGEKVLLKLYGEE